jgi:hypothetical protein
MRTPGDHHDDSGAGQQLHLIDPPPFSPKMPAPSTLEAALLEDLLSGETPTHPQWERKRSSWRLAVYVDILRKLGWPIETVPIWCPSGVNPARRIARYRMPAWVIEQVRR